ncbi:hypothetical protein [Methylomagnum ishizawai]|uniref:hypothetical protein n=1 Tax=Methylomagnum ishizawai TaxID=1760988 RepID=UPI001C33D45C|nr:hypothetical protein [Methylomagnum ishizawai]BBL74324.1 hypothetical protein MishRS11D_14220 [Methylomagnum ishizawai]
MSILRFFSWSLPLLAGGLAFLVAYGLLWSFIFFTTQDCPLPERLWELLRTYGTPAGFGMMVALPVYFLQAQREKLLTLVSYDNGLGQQNRYQLIGETERWLAKALGREGRTAVVMLQIMVDHNQTTLLPAEQATAAVQRVLTNSMRPTDLVVKLETGYVLVVAPGIITGESAQNVMKKVHSIAAEYCKTQFAEVVLAVKAGGFVCDKGDTARIAINGVFDVFRQAQEKVGDALVTDSSRRRSWKAS